jgi:hypothetical protein
LVINVKGITAKNAGDVKDGTGLDAYTPDSGWNESQLWTVALNPASTPNVTTASPPQPQDDFIFIESYLTDDHGKPLVMDIQGWQPGQKLVAGKALLDAFHQKSANTQNQLWALEPQGWSSPVPKITAFDPWLNLTDAKKSTVTVTGSGFYPGTTLVFTCAIEDGGGFTQPPPLLGVSDFAGNFSMTATLIAWGLAAPDGDGVVNQVGTFMVGVAVNSGSAPQPVAASASAQWNGLDFSGFTHS